MCSGSQATPTASGGTHSVRCRLQPPLPLLLLRAKTLSLRLITTQNVSKAIVSFTITLSQIMSHLVSSVQRACWLRSAPADSLGCRSGIGSWSGFAMYLRTPHPLPFRHWFTGWGWWYVHDVIWQGWKWALPCRNALKDLTPPSPAPCGYNRLSYKYIQKVQGHSGSQLRPHGVCKQTSNSASCSCVARVPHSVWSTTQRLLS